MGAFGGWIQADCAEMMQEIWKMSDYITTYTGKHFEPMNPDPELICIEDIAHALPMILTAN